MDPQDALKKAGVSRSWILLKCTGEGTVLDVDKYAIMHRVQIHARDLRIIDPLLSYPSAILGRERAIVLNLEHIKAIITAEEVLLRDPTEDNVVPVVEALSKRLSPAEAVNQDLGNGREHSSGQHDVQGREEEEFPFEFRALEVMLEATCNFLDARTTELEIAVYPALDGLIIKTSGHNLDRVRKLKGEMAKLTARVRNVRDELKRLLDNDDDMADLCLSRKLGGASSPANCLGIPTPNWFLTDPIVGAKISSPSLASTATIQGSGNNVEEIEMLLEVYFMQTERTLNRLSTLHGYVDDTEDYINIQLENCRNQLIQLELFLSSGTLCISIYSVVPTIFGMNIPFTWNDDHGYMFKWVIILAGMSSVLLFVLILSCARYKGLVGS